MNNLPEINHKSQAKRSAKSPLYADTDHGWNSVFADLHALKLLDGESLQDRGYDYRAEVPAPPPPPQRETALKPPVPWWHDTSTLAQRRRALKRWTGAGGKAALTMHDARVRHAWRLHDEGATYREIAEDMGWSSIGTVAYHLHAPRPKSFDVALSVILQRRDDAARIFNETPGCSMPSSTMGGAAVNAFRSWPISMDTNGLTAAREPSGAWRVGPYRC